MVYRKRSRNRRPASKTGFDKASQALHTATAALALAKMLKSLINVERKYNINANSVLAVNTGVSYLLNGTAQGDDDTDRNGRSVKATSVFTRLSVAKNALATNTAVRLIVYWDRQANGAAPATTDVLETASYLSALNKDYGKRFSVVWDTTCSVNTAGTTFKLIKRYAKLNRHVEYIGTTSGIGSIGANALYIMLISNEATNTPTVAFNNTFRFIDN